MREMDIQPVEGHEFQFTRNWFRNRNLKDFREGIYPRWEAEKRPLTYLEIGVFEGMSLVWMMQYLIGRERFPGYAVGIDPWLITTKLDQQFMDEVRQRAYHNVLPWVLRAGSFHVPQGTCTLQRGNSCEILRRMKSREGFLGIKLETLDLCMIDGDHNAYAVYDDAKLCYELLKPGGWMIFDDVRNQQPKKEHVEQGLEIFLTSAQGNWLKHVYRGTYIDVYEKV